MKTTPDSEEMKRRTGWTKAQRAEAHGWPSVEVYSQYRDPATRRNAVVEPVIKTERLPLRSSIAPSRRSTWNIASPITPSGRR